MSKPSHPAALIAALVAGGPLLFSTGCIGSRVPYRPGYEPRPEQVTVEDEESRALRAVVPIEIERNEWYLRQGRKRVGEILGEVHRNPWNAYEDDLAALGPDDADPYRLDMERRLLADYGPRHHRPYARARIRAKLEPPKKQSQDGAGGEDAPAGDEGGGWDDGGGGGGGWGDDGGGWDDGGGGW